MPRIFEGNLIDQGGRYAIVAARFNGFIVQHLVDGGLDALRRHGVDTQERVDVAWVPGAWEIPVVCSRLAQSGRYDAIIACGAVIRGATDHFDFVAGQAASGTASVATQTGVPVIFGILTTDTIEQAIERAGTKAGNKGFEAACTAIELVSLLRSLEA